MKIKILFSIVAVMVISYVCFKVASSVIVSKQNKLPSINTHAVYDIPTLDLKNPPSILFPTQTTETNPELTNVVAQSFKSGKIIKISLPAEPVATLSALKQGGLQITSSEYYLNIFHIQKLDDSSKLCDSLLKTNLHTNVFVKDLGRSIINGGSSMHWELTSQQGSTLEQLNTCYEDGKYKAFILDIYFPKKIYDEKYNKLGAEMIKSFSYTTN